MARRGGWLLAVLLGACAPAQKVAEAPLREVQQARAFRGEDGLHVEVLDFADGSALVRVGGVDSELTGKVLRYQRALDGDRLAYRTAWHGRDLHALVKERDGGWVAYIPGTQRGHALTYLEDRSAQVDGAAIQRSHQAQAASGELAALQRFDRSAAQQAAERELAEESARVAQACDKPLQLAVSWTSVSDAELLERSVSGYCESISSALRRLCEHEAGKRFVAGHVGTVTCSFDGDNTLVLRGEELRWQIDFDLSNADQAAYEALLALPVGQRTLEAQILAERTSVCADPERKHVVMVGPREAPHRGMAYGDGTQFSYVRTPAQLGDGWFFDPRQRNERNNDDFRGLDLRLFSHLDVDPAAGKCTLTCGTRETSLELLDGAEKHTLLERASFADGPMKREPHALARDKAGTYYYVDRGDSEATARDFRLYRGPRGRLQPLAMKDVVSDSEGEIFASTSGKLRLVLGKQSAQWIAGGTSSLQLLPVHENLGLIYNELGVYLGERLGVPCDDY